MEDFNPDELGRKVSRGGTLTKAEACAALSWADHQLLSPEMAEVIAKPFGVKPALGRHYDTRSEFKGLTLNGVNPVTGKEFVEGDYTTGIEAHILAEQIALGLGLQLPQMFGIGSRLRVACKAIKDFLAANG